MSLANFLSVIFLGIALSMDAFAISVTDGLIYTDINKKKSVFIAAVFGVMQGLMPLIGYWLIELIEMLVGETGGQKAGEVMSWIVASAACCVLLFLGIKMIFEATKEMKKPQEEKQPKKFSIKEVLIFGIATSIDALSSGLVLHSGISNYRDGSLWIHVSIIMVITFVISILGLAFGHFFEKLFKGKYEITSIIGGSILILLGIWVILSKIFGI